MTPADHPNLIAMFLAEAAARGDRPFLYRRAGRAWHSLSWSDCRVALSEAAGGLRALGLARGDRVVLVSENRPEWLLADLAILTAGGITVPVYTTHTVETYRYLLAHSGARAAIVSTPALLRRILAASPPELEFVVCLDPPTGLASSGPSLYTWEAVRASGRLTPETIDAQIAPLRRTDTARIQYTSGTGGLPRGAMLSHGAILANVEGGRRLIADLRLPPAIFLSFLPASHAYEHTAGQYLPIAAGGEIYYAESAAQVPAALVEVRPTILIAVPRLLETMHRRITQEAERRGALGRSLLRAAVALGRSRQERDGRLSGWARFADLVLEATVRQKIRARFGGRLQAIVSGGAPLTPDLGRFFHAVGLEVLQGFGLTEAGPIVSCNPPGRVRIETVGPPLAGVEVRIAGDGEILVRGENVMQGYWNDEAATAAAIREGWLHTGDIGRLDRDGYLTITDRKRDFLKTTGGEMIAPQKIEGALTLEPEIAQAMVVGDRRPHLAALIVPEREWVEAWGRAQGTPHPAAGWPADPDLQRAIATAVERAQRRLAGPEKIRRFTLLAEPFTIENELLTPTLKVRRHRVQERYREQIERMYDPRAT